MSDMNLPAHWQAAEVHTKTLIATVGYDAAKAAVIAVFHVHTARYVENPSTENYVKLQMTMNSLQVLKNEVKR